LILCQIIAMMSLIRAKEETYHMESLSAVGLCRTDFVCIQYLFMPMVGSVYLGKRTGEAVIGTRLPYSPSRQ